MTAAATLQRKPQGEDLETAPAVSATATPAIMPSRARVQPGRSALIQAQSFISSPHDAAEHEADRVAAHVVSMPDPSPKAGVHAPTSVMRSPLIVQRRAQPVRAAPKRAAAGNAVNVMPQVKAAASGGFALSKKTRAYLEPRFKADFSSVRIHTDSKAKELSNKVGARAFTFGRHIFFNEGQYNPDSKAGLELLAHELTHTIQQREAIQRKPLVNERTDPQVQRIGNPFAAVADAVGGAIDAVGEFVGDVVQIVKDFVAEHADALPGFKILCLVLGYNPINDAPAPGGGRAILKELTTFIPFGDKVFEALNNHGIIDKGGAFIDTQIANFKSLASAIIGAISSFFGSLGPSDALNPLGAWNRLKSSFTPVFASMKNFASGLISGFVDLVREVILKPMGRWAAANIPKWDLLMAVMGQNPVSGEGESPASAIIGAFMSLIGQDEVWQNIKKGNAINRAWAWFQGALGGAKALVSDIPGLVMSAIKSLTIVDVLTVIGAAQKIVGAFASFAGKFAKWALGTVLDLLEIVLSVVAPTVIPYLKKAGAAFKTIVQNPGAFISSLVAAGKRGFGQFAGNFVKHLKSGLIDWMTGSLGGAGVYIPQSFALRELLKFGLSVIGLTWANVRAKLVAATNEPTVRALEEGFKLVKTLVVEGPAAAWEQLLESLSNLKSMVMDAIIDYIKGKVVAIAVEKVLSMLTPAGAFIQAVLAIYRTITFIVGELRRIAALVAALIDGIAAIASGVIGPAANKVENILARGLSLAISFLANFAGLGDISKKVLQVLNKIRAPVNKAIDKVVAWIVAQAKKLGKILMGPKGKPVPAAKKDIPSDGEIGKSVTFTAPDGGHKIYVDKKGESADLMMASVLKPLSAHLTDFKKMAKDVDDPSSKAKVTGGISAASPLAKSIEKNAKKAAKKLIGTEERDALDNQIEADQVALKPILTTILDELGVKVPNETDPMTFSFVRGVKLDMGEYDRQLAGQAAGINAMSVEIWMGRRAQYAEFKQRAKDEGKTGKAVTGRDPRSAKSQKDAIEAAKGLIIQRLMEPLDSKSATASAVKADPFAQGIVEAVFGGFKETTRRNGMAKSTAEAAIVPYFGKKGEAKATVAALHEPDQVVGGKHGSIGGLGQSDVNSDIGANWGGMSFGGLARAPLAKNMEKQVKDFMKKKKVARAFWVKVKMNVVLK